MMVVFTHPINESRSRLRSRERKPDTEEGNPSAEAISKANHKEIPLKL